MLIVPAERKEEDSGGGDFVIGAISGAIVGVGCMINDLISGLACVSLTSRAYSIVAVLSFDLSIASCHISKNSDSTKETNLAEERERKRRRLAGDRESFVLIAMFACLIAGYLCRDINGLLSYLVDEPNLA